MAEQKLKEPVTKQKALSQENIPPRDSPDVLPADRKLERRRNMPDMKLPAFKILYFVDGSMPTDEEFEEANKLGTHVMFRNARRVVAGAPLENCDAVAGRVPEAYAAAFPSASAGMTVDPNKDELVKEVEEGEIEVKRRPKPLHPATSPQYGPDMRPGTVDTGIPATGGTSNNTPENMPPTAGESKAAKAAANWKSNEKDTRKPDASKEQNKPAA